MKKDVKSAIITEVEWDEELEKRVGTTHDLFHIFADKYIKNYESLPESKKPKQRRNYIRYLEDIYDKHMKCLAVHETKWGDFVDNPDFPYKYIKRGNFKLHSGDTTDVFYDVNAFIAENLKEILFNVPHCKSYVGIATGGAIIASHFTNFAIIKDKEVKGTIDRLDRYCLIDDVTTTENSLDEAIHTIGIYPDKIFVVVDRRPLDKRTIKLHCMFDVMKK